MQIPLRTLVLHGFGKMKKRGRKQGNNKGVDNDPVLTINKS